MEARVRPQALAVLAVALAATWLSILLVDRPAASFAHEAFHGAAPFVALTHLVDPLLPLAAIGFLGLGAAMLIGWQPPDAVRVLFGVCVATLLAVMIKDQLKYAFGRTWPETWLTPANPSWIHDGIMTFSPFHGGQGWTSFPSGHMTLITAPAVAVMLRVPALWRMLLSIPIALVAIGLYGADYHFVGDMIAGVITGTVCAAITMQAVGSAPQARPTR